jgi:ubiquinone/menaquinone biosynthesis C-methylase UbiE
MKKAKDNFSKQSELYQKFRPSYPEALIDTLCDRIPERNLAWDCATGNGQIAKMLSKKFAKVIATDISGEQLKEASLKDNIQYKIERAENSSLSDASVDLIVVAQAIHWFDFDPFYTEAKRVLKEGGLIAIIGYPLLTTENPELDKIIRYFYKDVVGSYWDDERNYIDERYATIPFPFDEFHLPEFEMKYNWTSEQLTGYLASWSAVAHYQRKNRTNPLELIKTSVEKFFNARKQVEVRFEIMGRYGNHL